MRLPPVIIIQLVHISGPMKGEIQEFSEGMITIGRHPSCKLKFPAEFTSISRHHAEIIREGNKFKLIDHSPNGTFVNGKRVQEIFLKDGDVLMFTEGGPKVSFLTRMQEGQVITEERAEPQPSVQRPVIVREEPKRPEPKKFEPIRSEPKKSEMVQPEAVQPVIEPVIEKPESVSVQPVSVQKVKAPLIIQYGTAIRSFNEVPVTIGKHPKCEFPIEHPAIYDQQAQIFFSQDQYWIKDLTGQGLIQINRRAIGLNSPIKLNDEISLSPGGPVFRFLGEGRLAEVEETPAEKPSVLPAEEKEITKRDVHEMHEGKSLKDYLSDLKNMFKR